MRCCLHYSVLPTRSSGLSAVGSAIAPPSRPQNTQNTVVEARSSAGMSARFTSISTTILLFFFFLDPSSFRKYLKIEYQFSQLFLSKSCQFGPVAQLGAHHIRIVGVVGSNPIRSTKRKAAADNTAAAFLFRKRNGPPFNRLRQNTAALDRIPFPMI